jgi:ABC-2 type transport system ATP-binding protein
VSCRDVSFSYGAREALDRVSFNIGLGVTGLLGPNGAGKSTLLNILATVNRPRSGEVVLNGRDPGVGGRRELDRIRASIGYLPQRFSLMMGATCLRNVAYAAWCNGVAPGGVEAAARDALALVDLAGQAGERAGRLSGGQRQRLGLACVIAHRPAVLLLDEPTVGLDPAQRVGVRRHLRRVAEDCCVLLSTHIVEDLVQMASNTVVLASGRVVFEGPVAELARLGSQGASESLSPVEGGYLALLEEGA